MTEPEWLASLDPEPMLDLPPGRMTPRKLRLYACACCRRLRGLMKGKQNRALVELAERFADGAVSGRELSAARNRWLDKFDPVVMGPHRGAISWATRPTGAPLGLVRETLQQIWRHYNTGPGEPKAQANLLRDILGNPFRPVAFEARWRTADAVGLARTIYDEAAFERMPILGDALMDAGCDSAAVLEHCRKPRGHARGCWVVDLVLGKA